MIPLANDPFVVAIVQRLRELLLREAACGGSDIAHLSTRLDMPGEDLQSVLDRTGPIDTPLLIDVVARVIRYCGVDPHWLLTGDYDFASHQDALELAENAPASDDGRLRTYVRKQLDAARELFTPWMSFSQLR